MTVSLFFLSHLYLRVLAFPCNATFVGSAFVFLFIRRFARLFVRLVGDVTPSCSFYGNLFAFFSRRTDFLSRSAVRTKCQCNDLSMLFWYPAMILWIFLKNHRICCGNNSIRTKRAATTFEIEQINYTWAYNFSCKNNNNSDVFECAVRNRREKRR